MTWIDILNFINKYNGVLSFCAGVATLVSTIVIAVLQHKESVKTNQLSKEQSDRMEFFEKRQDERDEKRYYQQIHAQAMTFLASDNHKKDRDLLPLCAIADKYDPMFPYSRPLYIDYCCLPEDVKTEVMKICHVRLRKSLQKYPIGEDFYELLLKAFDEIYKEYLPNDETKIFYDGGKYLYRALTDHGNETIPSYRTDIDDFVQQQNELPIMKHSIRTEMPLKEKIINALTDHKDEQPVLVLWNNTLVWTTDNPNKETPAGGKESLACYVANCIAMYVSEFYRNNHPLEVSNESDTGDKCFIDDYFAYDNAIRFEDLFLHTLLNIYENDVKETVFEIKDNKETD